ncbi:hypothetical protein QNH36_14530 [Mesobacillus sp. AQ2]|jgi:hypothetical protein|uniref:hypothetical protein n=1 Tax=Bacillaceae TaxID=186817 RepID=UPI0011AA6F61|nr:MULTISPECIES: hypothetical protein [Bacillaceae]MCM3121978.1 hypothetical protein [Mesobacillus sp. MER 33]MCM3231942.1 hypothetical protein [Mesobacillus sp. MER 48]WHX38901.1 hypothetical protein QNH36_14530 [Mesobacillus sp. AQ2]
MLMEIYAQSIEATAMYSVYLTLLISMSMSVLWALGDTSYIESCYLQIKLKPSVSEKAFKNKAELGTRFQLLILKRIKIKIDPGDEDSIFLLM